MKNTFKWALVLVATLLLSAPAYATSYNITISDNVPLNNPPSQLPAKENNEVEPNMVGHQDWDLEAMYIDDVTHKLTLVGGYDFVNGKRGDSDRWYSSGDIFIDVDGVPTYGPTNPNLPGHYTVSNTFGYDYVIHFDLSADPFALSNPQAKMTGTYSVYDISSSSSLVTVWYDQYNDASNPYRYSSGGALVNNLSGQTYATGTGLPGFADTGLDSEGKPYHSLWNGQGGYYWLTVDLSFLPYAEFGNFYAHYTMECGNDNLMAYNSNGGNPPVPEPATMLLLGSGLLGLAGLGRKKLVHK